MQVTQWFEGDVKPVRDGVYQRIYKGTIAYYRFSYGGWYAGYPNIELSSMACNLSIFDELPWRGIAKDE